LEHFRAEFPLLSTAFRTARELLDQTTPEGAVDLGIGPTFDELLELVQAYLDTNVSAIGSAARQDVGIYYWRQQMLNILENAIRSAGTGGIATVPILSSPEFLDTEYPRRFQWTGIVAAGKKTHANQVPCHVDWHRGSREEDAREPGAVPHGARKAVRGLS
jgi:hypothetical protein